jgi:hypothetical protein
MRVKLVVAAGAAAALLTAAAGAAAKPQPGGGAHPLPVAEATALAAAGVSSGSVTRVVSAEEALAAASQPDATVTVAPGLSLREAVGLGSAGATAAAVATEAATGCAANAAWWQWGTWPYEQRITDTTYWCAVWGDHITYRSSSVNGSGTLCSINWTGSALISGGIGYSWFVTRSSAGFACPTVIPWITLHPSHYLDVSRNAWGNSAIVGSG